jgi:hypothetical protein
MNTVGLPLPRLLIATSSCPSKVIGSCGPISQPRLIFGIPLLYAYMFAAWTLVVALVAFVARRRAG